jgi:hypothetical protein
MWFLFVLAIISSIILILCVTLAIGMYQTLAVVCHGTNPSQGSSRFEKQNAN